MDLALNGVQEEVQEREGGFSQDGSLSRAEDTNPSVTNFVRHIADTTPRKNDYSIDEKAQKLQEYLQNQNITIKRIHRKNRNMNQDLQNVKSSMLNNEASLKYSRDNIVRINKLPTKD